MMIKPNKAGCLGEFEVYYIYVNINNRKFDDYLITVIGNQLEFFLQTKKQIQVRTKSFNFYDFINLLFHNFKVISFIDNY